MCEVEAVWDLSIREMDGMCEVEAVWDLPIREIYRKIPKPEAI